MDDNARRRRQEQPGSSTSNTRFSIHDPNAPRRSYGAGGLDRYRPTALNASAPVPRSMGSAASYSGYYQEPTTSYSQAMPQSTMAYQPEYGQDNRQTQSYGAYNNSMMYNVPQAGAQSAVYDTSQQFPSRQAAGLQMMPADVAAPYFPSEPANAAAAASLQPQTAPSTTQTVYQQQNTTDQRMLHQNYPSGIVSMSGMEQTAAPEQAVEEQEYTAPTPASAPAPATTSDAAQMGEAYEQYQDALREVFTNIQNGSLQTASVSLLSISEWLLTKVVELGSC